MRRLFLFVLFIEIIFAHKTWAVDYVNVDVYGDRLAISNDTNFMPGIIIDTDAVNINASVRIENGADIYSDIYVCNGCDVLIRNYGNIFGNVHLGDFASITQIVHDLNDMVELDVDAPFRIVADGANAIDWGELVAMGRNAGTLFVRNSQIIVSNPDIYTFRRVREPVQIVMSGVITLDLAEDFYFSDAPVMENVSGDATFVISGVDVGPLHTFVANVYDNNLYIDLVRETDYYKILGDERGRFLNALREINPSDPLLQKLDSALNMDGLNYVLDHSIAFTPILLVSPMRILDTFMSYDLQRLHVNDGGVLDIQPKSFYINSDDFYIYGTSSDIVLGLSKYFYIGASLYGAQAQSDDEINIFSADMMGGNVWADFSGKYFYMHGVAGATYAKFDVPYVFHSGRMMNNLRGRSVYSMMDVGVRFGVVVPYIGAEYYGGKIISDRCSDINVRSGVNVVFPVAGESLQYEYRIGVDGNSANVFRGGIGVDLWSKDDMMGGSIGVYITNQDDVMSSMFSVSARAKF